MPLECLLLPLDKFCNSHDLTNEGPGKMDAARLVRRGVLRRPRSLGYSMSLGTGYVVTQSEQELGLDQARPLVPDVAFRRASLLTVPSSSPGVSELCSDNLA